MRKRLLTLVAFVVIGCLAAMPAAAKCPIGQAKATVEKSIKILAAKGPAGLAEVKALRFCGTEGYVFILNTTGVMLLHPIKPHLEKKNLVAIKDDKGKKFFVEFIAAAKKATSKIKGKTFYTGAGWISYRWPMPGKKGWFDKCTYCQGGAMGDVSVVACAGIYAKCK